MHAYVLYMPVHPRLSYNIPYFNTDSDHVTHLGTWSRNLVPLQDITLLNTTSTYDSLAMYVHVLTTWPFALPCDLCLHCAATNFSDAIAANNRWRCCCWWSSFCWQFFVFMVWFVVGEVGRGGKAHEKTLNDRDKYILLVRQLGRSVYVNIY